MKKDDNAVNSSNMDRIRRFMTKKVVEKGILYSVKTVKNSVSIPMVERPNPYMFKGGQAGDYAVEVGKSGTWATKHLPSGKVIQSTMPSIGGQMLGLVSLGVGLVNVGLGVYKPIKVVRYDDS